MSEEKEIKTFPSGVKSTSQPRLALIPHKGLVNAAKRFELGIAKYGETAWNNLSSNQSALQDKEWLIERCSHAVEHLYNIIDILRGALWEIDSGESTLNLADEAGAVAWCGLVMGSIKVDRDDINIRSYEVASNLDGETCYVCNRKFVSGDIIRTGKGGRKVHSHFCPPIEF